MRKTKIVATLGPATDDPKVLRSLIAAGLDVARLNFSHGSHEEQKKRMDLLRELCEEAGATVALLADTKGPEIRLGVFEEAVTLEEGSSFTLTTEQVPGTQMCATVSYPQLPEEVTRGTRILLDDGLIELQVEAVTGSEITTRVLTGGPVSSRKSVNVPGVSLDFPYISAADRSDFRFFVETGFDIVAASFVRSAEDVKELREELHRINSSNKIKIIAKIENADGVNNIDSIISVSDGLMVARGDLGVELPYVEVPILQKEIIKKCVSQGKPVITATQMLESMVQHSRPTRAEVADVANAIYDGTSAIMLSAETAVGKYPVEAVKAMAKIAVRTEKDIDYRLRLRRGEFTTETSITNAISHATVTTALDLRTAAILTVSLSGATAENVAKFRPVCPIIACTPDPVVQRQLKLIWGVIPLLTKKETDTAALFNNAVEAALKSGYINNGDLIVLTSGIPVGYSGTTNMLKVHVVGEKVLVS